MSSDDGVDLEHAARAFSIEDPGLIEDPDGLFGRLRRQCPVARSEQAGGFWIFSRYEDVRHLYFHPEQFSSRGTMLEGSLGQSRPLIPLEIDHPHHLGYRKLLLGPFSQTRVRRSEPMVRAVVGDLIDRFAGRGHCEFVAEFAHLLPTYAFVRFVGWPPEDSERFHRWADQAIHGVTDPDRAAVSPEEHAAARRAGAEELYRYFGQLLSARRHQPGDDLITELLGAEYEGRTLTDEEIVDICFLLVIAGFDTTRKILASAVAYLAEHPGQRDAIVADPALIPTATEELLRWESRIAVVRTANQEMVRGGVTIRRGDRILALTGSAGRDAAVYERADEVDLGRAQNNHLAFGAGAHRCIGIHFARAEIRIALQELHRRLPDYRIAAEGAVARCGGYGPGVDRLPLEFTPV